jgi:hypothetical protein
LDSLRKVVIRSTDAEVRRRAKRLIKAVEDCIYNEVRYLAGYSAQVTCIAISPDGKRVLYDYYDASFATTSMRNGAKKAVQSPEIAHASGAPGLAAARAYR